MDGFQYPEDGELKLNVAGYIVSSWQQIRLNRGLDRCPSDFDISRTDHAFRFSIDSLSDTHSQISVDGADLATAVDDTMAALKRPDGKPRVCDLAVIGEQSDLSRPLAVRRANYEKRHRYGRSQVVRASVDSWRDRAGRLWEPNYRVHVRLPALKLDDAEFVIGDVTYVRDAQGTRASLTLMPPEAYEPEPVILNLFDWQLREELEAKPKMTAGRRDSNGDDRPPVSPHADAGQPPPNLGAGQGGGRRPIMQRAAEWA